MSNETKLCNQCMQQKGLSQFKSYKTAGGLRYRNVCHQCEYANHRFNVLQQLVTDKNISDQEYETYQTLLTLFDTYTELGGHVSSGAYVELRGKTYKERTLEEQLAFAQQQLQDKRNASAYASKQYVTETADELLTRGYESVFVDLLTNSMAVWCENHYKPSFLRRLHQEYKTKYAELDEARDLVNTLATKIWDYEEYLVQTYQDNLPEWLNGEELIV